MIPEALALGAGARERCVARYSYAAARRVLSPLVAEAARWRTDSWRRRDLRGSGGLASRTVETAEDAGPPRLPGDSTAYAMGGRAWMLTMPRPRPP